MQSNESVLVSRSLLIFYVLVVYVFLQFLWWSYLLFNLNGEVSQLKAEIALLKGEDNNMLIYSQALRNKWLMIFGEGMVFLILLSLGIIQTRKTFKKEFALMRQQKNFLLSITHELKSPLASIKLYLQTLNKREFDKEKRTEIIGKAISDTDRLDNLVENMLLASRVENANFQLDIQDINLSAFLNDYAQKFNNKLKDGALLKTNIEPDLYMQGDKLYLGSMVENLLENAFKYSPENAEVRLSLHADDGWAVIKIADQGHGIPSHEKEHIFKKFYRAGNEETRSTKGTGLGLYIVSKLALMHKAMLQVHDNQPKGSIFELKFKLCNYINES